MQQTKQCRQERTTTHLATLLCLDSVTVTLMPGFDDGPYETRNRLTNITIEGVSLKHFQVCFTIARTKGDMLRFSTCTYDQSHDDPGVER